MSEDSRLTQWVCAKLVSSTPTTTAPSLRICSRTGTRHRSTRSSAEFCHSLSRSGLNTLLDELDQAPSQLFVLIQLFLQITKVIGEFHPCFHSCQCFLVHPEETNESGVSRSLQWIAIPTYLVHGMSSRILLHLKISTRLENLFPHWRRCLSLDPLMCLRPYSC